MSSNIGAYIYIYKGKIKTYDTKEHWHKYRHGLKARKLILLLEAGDVLFHLIGQKSSKLTCGSWNMLSVK